MKKVTVTFNLPITLAVALLSAAAMTLFFVDFRKDRESFSTNVTDTVVEEEPFDELAYYREIADEYQQTLPDDRIVIARLIDSDNHYIYYFERSDQPSCYCYDLESLTTSVLFGGENGFYCDTKLLIIGRIQDWKTVGDWMLFIAKNRAPGIEYPDSTVVFSMQLYSRELQFIDMGAEAYFSDHAHLTVLKASLIYRSLFTGKGYYRTTSIKYELDYKTGDVVGA